jgi:hypothetical protein
MLCDMAYGANKRMVLDTTDSNRVVELNAAIQAGSTRCDIPTKMDAKTQNWPPQSYGQSGPSRQLSAAWDLAAGLPAPVCPSDHSTEPEHTVG